MKKLVIVLLVLTLFASPCLGSEKADFKAANISWELGNHQVASVLYQQAISNGDLTESELSLAQYNLAIYYFMSEEFDAAMSEIQKVIEGEPENISAIGLRANIWAVMNETGGQDTGARALADWERILELEPADANTYNDRGLYYAERGELEKAIDDLEKFLALEPDNPDQEDLLNHLRASLAKQRGAGSN